MSAAPAGHRDGVVSSIPAARPRAAGGGDDDPGALVGLLHGDLVGLTRGKAVPYGALGRAVERGIGWVPANLALDPFGVIAPNPWGPTGEVRMVPDPHSLVRVARPGGLPPLRFALCDGQHPDGSPWDGCARGLLARTLAALQDETGLRVQAAFEHEFQLRDADGPVDRQAFSLGALWAAEPFPTDVTRALQEAGVEPEMLISEYGPGQFEAPCAPALGVRAADRALVLREVVREVARRNGRRATFSPLVEPSGVGNGVHVHVSLIDAAGADTMGDAAEPHGLSPLTRSFVAGILRHAAALCALAAPSPISALRLTPGRWSAGHVVCGRANRDALVRVIGDPTRGEGVHVEFRGADATANPHLVLAAVVQAGLDGVRTGASELCWSDEDPAMLDEATRRARGIETLPASLDDALAALDADPAIRDWLPPGLHACFVALKRHELATAAAWTTDEERCAAYAEVY